MSLLFIRKNWSVVLIGGMLIFALNTLFLAARAEAAPKLAGKVSTTRSRSARSNFIVPSKLKKIAATDKVTVALGGYKFEIPGTSFKRSGKKNSYQYSAKRGALGLTSIKLDSKAKTIAFVVQGVPLIDQRYPMRLDVSIGKLRNCDLIGGQGKGSVTKKSLVLYRLGRCPIDGESLTSSIGSLSRGASTETIFRLDAKSPVVAPAVYLADGSGASSAKVCDMSDKGDSSTGDAVAGDNSYACRVVLNGTLAGKQYFVARGKRGGTIIFPGLALQVIEQISEKEAQAALSVQISALDLWLSISYSMGETIAARLEAIQKILALPGVAGAVISPNGIDIVITMISGLEVVLVVNTKPLSSPAITSSAFSLQPRATSRRSTHTQLGHSLSASAPMRIFLYDPGYFPNLENESLKAFGDAADPAEVQITVVKDSAAMDVHSLDAAMAFDFALLTTHGSVDSNGRVGFVVPLKNEAQIADYLPLLQSGKILLSGTQNIGPGIGHSSVLVMPDYFLALPGAFQNTTVIGSSCYSAANGSMAGALLSKGAAAFLGYDEVVFSDFAAEKANEFFCSTLIEKKSVGEAYEALSPKTDDTPYVASGESHTNATVRFVGNPSTLLSQSTLFDNFKILLDPPRHLLFHGESASTILSIGGDKLPPCLKFKLRNNSSALVSVTRQKGSGQSVPVGDELFSDDTLKFIAGTTNGVADLSIYLARESNSAIVGQRKPVVEVLCAKPTIGTFAPAKPSVQLGEEVSFNFTQLSAPGCDLRIGFSLFTKNESDVPTFEDATCGTPLNVGAVALPEMGGWSIPVSQLPLRLSTAGCTKTRKISVIYNIYIAAQSSPEFDDARFINENPLVSSVVLTTDSTVQSGFFETKFILYTRDVPPFGTLDRYYFATLPFITPPSPGQVARYCLKVDTHGIPGPDNQQLALPNPADYEYLVVSEDVCERLSESPGFYTPTPAECQGWLGGKMALFGFGPGNSFGTYASGLAGESPGCEELCTPSQALDYYASLRSWTYTARLLNPSQFNCSSP